MDGVRTAEGGEGVTGAMIRARIWVDGRLAGGLQALLGAPMAAYSGCGERDGGIGHGKRRSRTGLARVCTTCSPRPMRAVQRARLWAITCTASQAALAAKRPEGRWFNPTPCLRLRWTQSVGQNRGHVKSGSCCLAMM